MSLSDQYVKVECELKLRNYCPKPSYHPQNKDVVIISTNIHEGKAKGIYAYNLIQNTFNKIYTYKPTFEPNCHGQFIDSKNGLLYIFGGVNATF
eukprot:486961_1